MEEYDEYEDFEPKSFREKLEDSVEPALKIVAYILLILGILYTIFATISAAGDRYINGLAVLLILIGGLLASYLTWAGIMFALRIGANINRIRELMEEKADK